MGILIIQYRIHDVRDPEKRKNIVVEDRETAKYFWLRGHQVDTRSAYAHRFERRSHSSNWEPTTICTDPIDEDLSWQQFVQVMREKDKKSSHPEMYHSQ